MRQTLISAGIDIGTSTTQLVFSRLTVENLASDYTVPHIDVVERKVIYKSDIYFTPLLSNSEIDSVKVREIIEREYKRAGILPEQVSTGAVIITGETARKKNADSVLDSISRFAGDFVVTTAGPHLESALSGRGAGADSLSKTLCAPVVNIDIGGGTSNFSLFCNGELKSVSCMDIGGRLVKTDISGKNIVYISKKAEMLSRHLGLDLAKDKPFDCKRLKALCKGMADLLFAGVSSEKRQTVFFDMLTGDSAPLIFERPPEYVSFSGGVADFIYGKDANDAFKYGDIGVLLGREIKKRFEAGGLTVCRSGETIRATVIGAGLHTTVISGSTIYYTGLDKPVKNIPILRVSDEKLCGAEVWIRERLALFSNEGRFCEAAIAFDGGQYASFEGIRRLARWIAEGANPVISDGVPLIVVVEKDIAKALGYALDRLLEHKRKLICIDGIKAFDGDYIDIGLPIAGGNAVPVVVKTLIFNT